ncbi:hypothetical protein ED92_10790 [Amycolatopsis sp. MJM2582]|nr:hypothetical protein ED92_10790 [Amycolatopsis sp. MJM2582]
MTIRCYSGPNLPEMLMTPMIAHLMWKWRAAYQPALAAVGTKLSSRRRAVLERASRPRMVFVVGEEALMRFEAGKPDPTTAAEQMRTLGDDAAKRHVSVLIYPLSASALPADRFVVTTAMDGRTAVFSDTPGPSGLRVVRDLEQVEAYVAAFTALRGDSLSEDASRARIAEAFPPDHAAASPGDGDRADPPPTAVGP